MDNGLKSHHDLWLNIPFVEYLSEAYYATLGSKPSPIDLMVYPQMLMIMAELIVEKLHCVG